MFSGPYGPRNGHCPPIERSGDAYCWQVVALGGPVDCYTVGPVWTFQTRCVDPVAGAPAVTSTDATYPIGTTSGSYALTFSEAVNDVASNLTWSPLIGTGTMGAVTENSSTTYSVDFTGVADGDAYTLSVGVGVTDSCGTALGGPTDIIIAIQGPGAICSSPADVTSETFPFHLYGVFDDDPSAGGSCDPSPNNAVWFTFTPPPTTSYTIQLQNHTTTFAYSRVAVFQTIACGPYGAEIACEANSSRSISTTVNLTQGITYLILFYTDGESYTMVNPEITITP